MGRSVSYPGNTMALAFTHLTWEHEDDAHHVWREFEDDIKEAVKQAFPVRWRSVDVWNDEDHGVLKCDYALFGYSEYCGLVSVWLVPVEPEEDADATEVLAYGLFAGTAQDRLNEAVENATGVRLRHRGTFSNGEAVFERV